MRAEPKIVYLDQKAWINLARSYYNKTEDKSLKKALHVVLRSVESDKALFPLSHVHLTETLCHLTYSKRKKLVEFMIKVSKGNTILPFTKITKLEIHQAVLKKLGFKTSNLRHRVMGKGIPHLYNSRTQLKKSNPNTPDLSQEREQAIIETLSSVETLRFALNQDIAEDYKAGRIIEEEVLNQIEENRAKDNLIADIDLRYRIAATRFFINHIIPELERISIKHRISVDKIFSGISTKEDIERFFQSIPTAYVLFSLIFRRDIQKHRRVQKNDSNDIAFLTIAIPYCDIIVTEKFWVNLVKQSKLDKLYDTKILSSIKDLPNYLVNNNSPKSLETPN